MTPRVHILAKAPVSGCANTRLVSVLGAKGAAHLARLQLLNTVSVAHQAGLGRVSLWVAPGRWHPAVRTLARRHGLRLRPQGPGDLGARMFQVARTAIRNGEWPILLGTDCIDLSAQNLIAAAQALEAGADAVVGPAHDGGYYLLALRRPHPALFRRIPWSTGKVLECTLKRLRQGGWPYRLLPPRYDLDRPADLVDRSPHAIARTGRL